MAPVARNRRLMLGSARISRGRGGLERAEALEILHGHEFVATVRPTGALIGDSFPLASEATGASGLAERYAAALFDLADERRALDAVAGDLRELRAMLQQSRDLLRLLRSPVLSRDEQGKAVAALAERAG